MKKLALTLILIAIGKLLASAQLALNNSFYNVFLNEQGSRCGAQYIFCEDFEGPGYQGTWTENGTGTFKPDDTVSPSPLERSYSLRITLSAQNGRTTNIFSTEAITNTVYGFFAVRFPVRPSDKQFFGVYSNDARLYFVQVRNVDNTISIGSEGGCCSFGGSAVLNATTNYVWFQVNSSGSMDVQVSLDQVNANAFTTLSISSFGGNRWGNRIVLGSISAGATYTAIYDKIRLSTNSIGDNPP